MGTQASKKSIGRRYESWWSQAGSNRRPLACHASALPAELWPPIRKILYFKAKLNLISPKCYRKMHTGPYKRSQRISGTAAFVSTKYSLGITARKYLYFLY